MIGSAALNISILMVVAGTCLNSTGQTAAGLSANRLSPPRTENRRATVAACDAIGGKPEGAALHSVTLSWNESRPTSTHPRDAVIGYIVYRSTKSHDPKPLPINVGRLVETKCVDTHVAPGMTYYYVVRAVSASGGLSGPSNEAHASIPVVLQPGMP
jgi:hypothetical protein